MNNEPFFDTIQDWAEHNMVKNEWGCHILGETLSKDELKKEYPHGWEVAVKHGKYWVWPGNHMNSTHNQEIENIKTEIADCEKQIAKSHIPHQIDYLTGYRDALRRFLEGGFEPGNYEAPE